MMQIRHTSTLFYYDGPQVFEARDAIGGHYIAVKDNRPDLWYPRTKTMTDIWLRASTLNDLGNSGRGCSTCERCSSNRTTTFGIWRRW